MYYCPYLRTVMDIKNLDNKYFFTFVLSLIFLYFFSYNQSIKSEFLNLDTQWIILSFLPFLLVLLFSEKVKKINLFGIEIETEITKPIKEFNKLNEEYKYRIMPKFKKGNNEDLNKIGNRNKDIKILNFQEGLPGYYDAKMVCKYIDKLINLSFFQIVDSNGKYKALVNISDGLKNNIKKLKKNDNFDDIDISNDSFKSIESFIEVIENKTYILFENNNFIYTTDFLNQNSSLIECYEKFIELRPISASLHYRYLPIVNDNNVLVSVIDEFSLIKKISDETVKVLKNNN